MICAARLKRRNTRWMPGLQKDLKFQSIHFDFHAYPVRHDSLTRVPGVDPRDDAHEFLAPRSGGRQAFLPLLQVRPGQSREKAQADPAAAAHQRGVGIQTPTYHLGAVAVVRFGRHLRLGQEEGRAPATGDRPGPDGAGKRAMKLPKGRPPRAVAREGERDERPRPGEARGVELLGHPTPIGAMASSSAAGRRL